MVAKWSTAACGLVAALATAAASPMNVLFIAVDDLRPEHGVFGGAAITPNIDKFAAGATTFVRNYVQVGVCSPSRTSLLTGRYPDTNHVTDLYKYFRSVGCNVTTLPQAFKNAGYTTTGANKIFHPGHASGAGLYPDGGCPGCNGFNDPPSWSQYFIAPSNQVYPWNVTYGASWMALPEAQYPPSIHPDSQAAAYMVSQLQAFAAAGTPFFAAPGFYKPHLPFIFPASYLDLYADYDEVAPDATPPVAEESLSWTAWGEFRSYSDIAALINASHINLTLPGDYMPRAKQVEMRKAYFAAVSYNDDVIGQVLDALDATGLASNTVVLIWGDHGWQLNDNGDWSKHTNFESVTRAPLLIRSPAHPASWGKTITAFTHHIDIYPTLLELTGLAQLPPGTVMSEEEQDGLQGLSLVPLLENPSLPSLPGRGPYAYSQYPRHEDNCGLPSSDECGNAHAMGYTIRTSELGGWRYTEWVPFDNNTFTPNFTVPGLGLGAGAGSSGSGSGSARSGPPPAVHQVELYSHAGDTNGFNWTASERVNLASDPAYASVVANLSAMLHAGPNLLHPTKRR